MRSVFAVVVIWLALALLAGRADAYPQYQMSRDRMCTSCHLSPSGGGLLTENGLNTAEVGSQLGTRPEFLNGAVTPPSWLALGGDLRGMGGYLRAPQRYLEAFPMQADLYARATFDHISVNVTAGMRPARFGNEALTRVWAREHYVQWQQNPGLSEGLYVRAGHLMPVFGLRLAEHPAYTRRYGGTPLFSETYGVSASYVTSKYEGHATGFIVDPVIDGVRLENGAAVYGEYRLCDWVQVGAGGMLEINDWEKKFRGAVTAKQSLPMIKTLVQGELQVVNPHVGGYGWTQLVGYVMASYFPTDAIMVDLGLGHYDENVRIKNLDRNAVDLNVHWFVTSHFEAMLVTRYEQIGITGTGGPYGEYAMLQAHYRL